MFLLNFIFFLHQNTPNASPPVILSPLSLSPLPLFRGRRQLAGVAGMVGGWEAGSGRWQAWREGRRPAVATATACPSQTTLRPPRVGVASPPSSPPTVTAPSAASTRRPPLSPPPPPCPRPPRHVRALTTPVVGALARRLPPRHAPHAPTPIGHLRLSSSNSAGVAGLCAVGMVVAATGCPPLHQACRRPLATARLPAAGHYPPTDGVLERERKRGKRERGGSMTGRAASRVFGLAKI